MDYKQHFPIFKVNENLTYLDSAATAQKPQQVIDRIQKFYSEENANVHRGIYDLSEKATEEYESARKVLAKFINAKSEKEIIFTSGTTDSINLVGYSWIWLNIDEGDILLTTQMEHHSNFIPWQQAAKHKKDIKLELVSIKSDFTLDLEDLEKKLKEFQPKIFAFTHCSNVLGTINPIKEIVEIKNRVSPNTKILIDAAQSIVHMPIDVQELGIDFLAFSGHKLYGPTGIGVFWAKEEIQLNQMSPYRYGGGMIRNVEIEDSEWADLPERFEGGTPNIAGAIGLSEAIDFIEKIGFNQIQNHESELTNYTILKLKELEGIKIFGPDDLEKRSGVISIGIDGIHPHDIAQILNEDNVAVRAGHHCNQILMRDVLKVPATTRISLGIYNNKSDIDKLVSSLRKVIKMFN